MALHGSEDTWLHIAFFVLAVLVAFAVWRWEFFLQRMKEFRGRRWPTMSATIKFVNVIKQEHQAEGGPYYDYLAILTYFYKNPDLQAGDYKRLFMYEEEAQAWANSYKDCSVLVHVDPHDPSESVLDKRTLDRI